MQDGGFEAQELGLGCTQDVYKTPRFPGSTLEYFSGDSNAHLSLGTTDMDDMNSMPWKILKEMEILLREV